LFSISLASSKTRGPLNVFLDHRTAVFTIFTCTIFPYLGVHRHLSGHVSLQGFTTTLYHDVFASDHPSSSHSLSPDKTPLLSNHVIDLKFLTYFGASEKRPLEHEGLGMVAATYRPERVSVLSYYKGKSDPLLCVIATANMSFDHGQGYQK